MHVLAIDAGNSRIKWGVWNARWLSQDFVPTADAGQLASAWGKLPSPLRVIACSVAGPQVRAWIDRWAQDAGVDVYWASSRAEQCGVRNRYDEPTQLGADRWVCAIAARHLVSGAAIAVHAGTAVTVNALSAEGDFLGGLILPGLDLMAESLARGTAGLPRVAGEYATFPRNTADAIASGAIQAVCGAIERTERALAALGATPQILLGGGAGELIQRHLQRPAQLTPNLVLEGLRIIAQHELAA